MTSFFFSFSADLDAQPFARQAGFAARCHAILVAAALSLAASASGHNPAAATDLTPRRKPPIAAIAIAPTTDASALQAIFASIERGDIAAARRSEGAVRDKIARDLARWAIVANDPNASWSETAEAIVQFAGWPRARELRLRAEQMLARGALSAGQTADWLMRFPPLSGLGALAQAQALNALGEREQARQKLKALWRERNLPVADQSAALSRFAGDLTREDHEARVDLLIWLEEFSTARALFSQLSPSMRAAAEARILLAQRSRTANAALAAVPAGLQETAGVQYERARWRRRNGLAEDALPLLQALDPNAAPLAARDRVWDELGRAARTEIGKGAFDSAYRLTRKHSLARGEDFAEAEFLSGWLALRLRPREPEAAAHFSKLESNVSTPVSLSRAQFWQARALAAQGDDTAAATPLNRAASHATTFFGLMARAQLAAGPTSLAPLADPPIDPATRARFLARPMAQAMLLLADIGETDTLSLFALAFDDQLESAADHALLADLLREAQLPNVAVRTAKTGLAAGRLSVEASFPLLAVPRAAQARGVEQAFVLAISRQESEFNQFAVSRANARGLMQLIPSTAQFAARREGLSYQRALLTDDPDYNMTLGASYLAHLLDQFGGSYVLAIAAYNAGPSNVNRWIAQYGDPRQRGVDILDWIEQIPFAETRNYVHRVLENLQVYRQRLAAETPIPLRIREDLQRGVY